MVQTKSNEHTGIGFIESRGANTAGAVSALLYDRTTTTQPASISQVAASACGVKLQYWISR